MEENQIPEAPKQEGLRFSCPACKEDITEFCFVVDMQFPMGVDRLGRPIMAMTNNVIRPLACPLCGAPMVAKQSPIARPSPIVS